MILGIKETPGARRTSFNRLHDAADGKWRTESLECFIASDASAVIEHTKK
jgi:glucosamine--fructose-6-phosphate aminotransferase (isomerizing)